MVTVKETIGILREIRGIDLMVNGRNIMLCQGEGSTPAPEMVDVFGDYCVDELFANDDGHFTIYIATRLVKREC